MSLCVHPRCQLMREHTPDECGWPVEQAALPVREAPREHIVRQDYDSATVSGSPTTGSEPQKEQVMNDSTLDINDMIKSGPQPLPCPLCAGPAYAFWSVNGEQMFKVGCPPCGLELKAAWYRGTDKPTKDILTLWNTRLLLTTGSEPPQDTKETI